MKKTTVGIAALLLGSLAGYGIGVYTSPAATRLYSRQQQRLLAAEDDSDAALKSHVDVIRSIQKSAVFIEGDIERHSIVADALKAYLAQRDPYSDLLTPGEYVRFKAFGKQQYVGIGAEMEKSRDGAVLCFPYANGPAARAGIEPGDRVIAIQGKKVWGQALPSLLASVAGEAGSPLSIEVEKKNGSKQQIVIVRNIVQSDSIVKEHYGGTPAIRISRFAAETREQLSYLLSTLDKTQPLIVDLRGNSGGDFYAAIDSAMLFLKRGEPIVSVVGKGSTKQYASTLTDGFDLTRVFLWQDETTASAAEVFIAALTDNEHATSIGKKTLGKGTKQEIIELPNGAALILTTGYLRTPQGGEIDGRGLSPHYPLAGAQPETADYLSAMEKAAK